VITTNAPGSQSVDELSLHHLLKPEVLANPYPLYDRLRTEDPVHWDPYLHTWVVTRYKDVLTVLHDYSACRSPTPEQLESLGLSYLSPIARVLIKQMLFLDPPSHTRIRSLQRRHLRPIGWRPCAHTFRRFRIPCWIKCKPRARWRSSPISPFPCRPS